MAFWYGLAVKEYTFLRTRAYGEKELSDRYWLISRKDIFLGTLNCGHPGGMLPLTPAESQTLHSSTLPANMYVADASILPESPGLPPILTIMALAKRISKLIKA